MSVAIVAISQEHGYTKSQQGLILASFFVGYILTPILGGALADRYGGKHVLGFGNEHKLTLGNRRLSYMNATIPHKRRKH
jgi:MFS family permease